MSAQVKFSYFVNDPFCIHPQSYNMYLFTKGDGPLKTTHDLFTQAEFFAEQANKMHKCVREFAFEVPFITIPINTVKSFKVPGSAEKNELLQILEKIPLHCQQLQVLVKSPTVGKTATFSKVLLHGFI